MPVLKRGQHTLVVRQRRQHDADVKDLVRREEQVESSRCETFWNSVRAARFFRRRHIPMYCKRKIDQQSHYGNASNIRRMESDA